MENWESDNADQLVLEEPGSARLGLVQGRAQNNLRDPNYASYNLNYGLLHVNPNLVQLNSGSTNFNTTLNLTGPILLGLGIAAATLFYAYFNAFKGSGHLRQNS